MVHEGKNGKRRKMQFSCHLQKNDPKEQLLSILKCEKNSSHIHVKTAIVLSLSCLNIRLTFV